jgi:hypothetical protein
MTEITQFVATAFDLINGDFAAVEPIVCAGPTLAIQTAPGQWKVLGHAGAVAFSRTSDFDKGKYNRRHVRIGSTRPGCCGRRDIVSEMPRLLSLAIWVFVRNHRPRLKITPAKHARKYQEHQYHRCTHQHRINRHHDLR